MIKTYRGNVVWWVEAYEIEDPYINRRGLSGRRAASGFRLARTQQTTENTEGNDGR